MATSIPYQQYGSRGIERKKDAPWLFYGYSGDLAGGFTKTERRTDMKK